MEAIPHADRCVAAGRTAPSRRRAGGRRVVANEIQWGATASCRRTSRRRRRRGVRDPRQRRRSRDAPFYDDFERARDPPRGDGVCDTVVSRETTGRGVPERKSKGLGAAGSLLFASTSDPSHDISTSSTLRPAITDPRRGPDPRDLDQPTPSGPSRRSPRGHDTDFDGVINGLDTAGRSRTRRRRPGRRPVGRSVRQLPAAHNRRRPTSTGTDRRRVRSCVGTELSPRRR